MIEGVCKKCDSAPAVLGKTLCKECLIVAAAKQRIRYYELKMKGGCVRCGKKSKALICPICRAKDRKRAHENNNLRKSGDKEELPRDMLQMGIWSQEGAISEAEQKV